MDLYEIRQITPRYQIQKREMIGNARRSKPLFCWHVFGGPEAKRVYCSDTMRDAIAFCKEAQEAEKTIKAK